MATKFSEVSVYLVIISKLSVNLSITSNHLYFFFLHVYKLRILFKWPQLHTDHSH